MASSLLYSTALLVTPLPLRRCPTRDFPDIWRVSGWRRGSRRGARQRSFPDHGRTDQVVKPFDRVLVPVADTVSPVSRQNRPEPCIAPRRRADFAASLVAMRSRRGKRGRPCAVTGGTQGSGFAPRMLRTREAGDRWSVESTWRPRRQLRVLQFALPAKKVTKQETSRA